MSFVHSTQFKRDITKTGNCVQQGTLAMRPPSTTMQKGIVIICIR